MRATAVGRLVRPAHWNVAIDEVAAYERRFRRAGLPLLIEDYSAAEDVFTRAAPLLALVFIAEMLGAIDLQWSFWANVGAALGGLAILLGVFGALNLARGRRFWSLPNQVGRIELAVFVFLTALLPVIFGGQVRSALVTAAGNALLLALVYGVVGYGLISIVRWSSLRLLSQFAAAVATLTRAVPLLLLFALVLFASTEMWQVCSTMPPAFLAATGGLLVFVGWS